MRILALLLAALACAQPARATEPVMVTVVGDSVVLVVAVADNAAPQPVAVDSVVVTAGLGQFGSDRTARVAKVSGVTTARLAWPLSAWGANQTLGSTIRVKLGRTSPSCAGGVCWSAETVGPAWSYLNDARAPDAPEATAITAPSVGLN